MTTAKHVCMLLSNPFRPDTRVLKEAESLAAAGYRVTILCWDRQAELPRAETLPSGVAIERIHHVRSGYGIGFRQLLRLPRFWLALLTRLRRLRPDLLHCHDFDTLPPGLWYGRLRRLPVIYDAHEYFAELTRPRLHGLAGGLVYRMIRSGEHLCARLAQAVVTVDETLGAIYRRLNRRVLIVGHYPLLETVGPPSPAFTHDELRLVYVGRLSVDRGLLIYVEILRLLREQGLPARLILAGSFTPAADRERMEAAANAAGVADAIAYQGFLPSQDVPAFLRTGDVGLALLQPIPRFQVAVPVKLFEYMAAGVPVLISDFSPVRAILAETPAGALLDPTNPEAAAARVAAWWAAPERPRMLGVQAQEAIRTRYNWERLMDGLTALYASLLET